MRSSSDPNHRPSESTVSRTLARARRAWWRIADKVPLPGRRPPIAMVVGTQRSGTTLLYAMLNAHSQIALVSESRLWAELFASGLHRGLARDAFVEFVVSHPRWPSFGVEAAAFRSRVERAGPFSIACGMRAFYEYFAESAGKPRAGDKTPKYAWNIAAIAKELPEARFIHLIRDGRDVLASMRDAGWLKSPRPGRSVGHTWRRTILAARTQQASVRHYVELSYEALVSEPERSLREACRFLDLPYEPRMLEYHSSWRATTSIHRLVGERPRPDRIGRWREALTPEEIADFESEAGPLLRELGYD